VARFLVSFFAAFFSIEASHFATAFSFMLKGGASWSAVHAAFDCSRATVAKVAKRAAA
jgi:hypothetical protein